MKRIYLTNSPKRVTVDDQDYERLIKNNWWLHRDGWAAGYDSKTRQPLKMHRLILRVERGVPVDHKNRDKLDNRRINLRLADWEKNSQNRPKARYKKKASSRFKGVYFYDKKWRAYINHKAKRIWLGTFETEEEGARAYNAAARKKFGDFCCLNPI